MSYTSSYANRPPSRKGLAITIGLHALLALAIMAMPAITVPGLKEGTLITTHIPADPEPVPTEPITEPVTPKPQTAKANPVKPVIKPPVFEGVTPTRFREVEGTIASGSGEGVIDIPIKPLEVLPEPDIVAATLNNRFSRQFQPAYPPGLLRRGEEGLVTVRVLVGADGRAQQIELIDSPNADFWTATRKHALKKWRFNPATRDGVTYASWITLKVKFTIND